MYDYGRLKLDAVELIGLGADVSIIGQSLCKRDIICAHVGDYRGRQAIIQGGIHAREHITSAMVAAMAFDFLRRYRTERIEGGIYFVPMSNPDGVMLCAEGLNAVSSPRREFLHSVNGSADFSLWKANAAAVDLNVNFDARWGNGVQNSREPGAENYIGTHPASEPETRALMRLTERVKPFVTLSYHCKGREIYWRFFQEGTALERAYDLAVLIGGITGYAVKDYVSAGGYKDWCVQKFGIPALTVEIVDDCYDHPVPYSSFCNEYERNKNVPVALFDRFLCD